MEADPVDKINLLAITKQTQFSRTQLRRYLAKYLPERICWTGVHPQFNMSMTRDFHRYYWASKMAKDFVMLTN